MNRYNLDQPKPLIYAFGFGGLSLQDMVTHKVKGSAVDVLFAPLHEASMREHSGVRVDGLPAKFEFIPYNDGGFYRCKNTGPQEIYDYLCYNNFVFVEDL